jgi:hypothetical protein
MDKLSPRRSKLDLHLDNYERLLNEMNEKLTLDNRRITFKEWCYGLYLYGRELVIYRDLMKGSDDPATGSAVRKYQRTFKDTKDAHDRRALHAGPTTGRADFDDDAADEYDDESDRSGADEAGGVEAGDAGRD